MRTIAIRHRAVIGLSAVALITVGCSNGTSVDVPSPEVGLIATTSSAAPAQRRGQADRGEGRRSDADRPDCCQVFIGE